VHDLIQDIRYGFRAIAKNPAFAAVVIFTLGLGIGINTTVFISANAVVFRPFPYEDPSRIVAVRTME
jgi:putative ABC transport system permease protein